MLHDFYIVLHKSKVYYVWFHCFFFNTILSKYISKYRPTLKVKNKNACHNVAELSYASLDRGKTKHV